MNEGRNTIVQHWISAKDDSRRRAVDEAARLLLHDYMQRWEHLVPVELHRLAASLNTEIVRPKDFQGEAVLLPVRGGFRVLVNSGLPTGRYRASVAHELVHTLFYSMSSTGEPKRIVPKSKREEHFCFDVGRHLLAPVEHLELLGAFRNPDPVVLFSKLTDSLLISRPWAARLVLADHLLFRGIGGRWVSTASGWKQQPGGSAATPSLSQKERARLRNVVVRHLKNPEKEVGGCRILCVPEKSAEGIFVLVTIE